MLEIKEISDLRSQIASWKKEGKKVAFVPTMGALHDGHLSLIHKAKELADEVVCSIFVNPTQFNDPEDFKKYPRTEQRDLELLRNTNCSLAFLPEREQIYAEGEEKPGIDFGQLTRVLEASNRPGHFEGVVQIVGKLFDLVEPDIAIFGKKDFQQLAVIRCFVAMQGREIEIVGAPIEREQSGLAMSSRNVRLSDEGLESAALIHYFMGVCASLKNKYSPKEIIEIGKRLFKSEECFELEYLEIIENSSWASPESFDSEGEYRLLCAVWLEGVRLIDNCSV